LTDPRFMYAFITGGWALDSVHTGNSRRPLDRLQYYVLHFVIL